MTNYSATRRSLLTGAGAVFAWAYLPEFARAVGERDPRLVVFILRGALDGLSAVAPVGDPDYLALHGSLALSLGGDHPALPLDSFFALNLAMPVLKRAFRGRARRCCLSGIVACDADEGTRRGVIRSMSASGHFCA